MACFRLLRLIKGTGSAIPGSGFSMRSAATTSTRRSSSFFASKPVASLKSSRSHSSGTSSLRCGIAKSRLLPFDRLAVHFHLRHVGPSTGTVSAAGQKIREADLIHLAQVGIVHPISGGDDFSDVQLEP